MEIDLPSVHRHEKPVFLLVKYLDHPPSGCLLVGLDIPVTLGRVILELSLGAVERVPYGDINVFLGMIVPR